MDVRVSQDSRDREQSYFSNLGAKREVGLIHTKAL